MALIEKIKAIADAIRAKTGMTGTLTLDEMAETITHLETDESTYILVDDYGNEVLATLVDDEVVLTSTPNDIRLGTTAITDYGFVVGEKEIPAYRAEEGHVTIKPGKTLDIPLFSDMCHYTTMQVIVCAYNTSIGDSVSSEKVAINGRVYNMASTVALSLVTVDADAQTIKLGLTNDGSYSLVVRFMIIKEDSE